MCPGPETSCPGHVRISISLNVDTICTIPLQIERQMHQAIFEVVLVHASLESSISIPTQLGICPLAPAGPQISPRSEDHELDTQVEQWPVEG